MPNTFGVGGRTAATAATANNVGGTLWNPSSNVILRVREIHWFKTVATADNIGIAVTTTRGTQTSTVTPDADCCFDRNKITPLSGALLDVTYSAQPTVASPYILRNNLPAAIGAGFIYVFNTPWEVLPGTGLCVATPQAVILQPADLTFIWEE